MGGVFLKKQIHMEVVLEIVPVMILFLVGQTTVINSLLGAYIKEQLLMNIKMYANYLSVVYTILVIGFEMNKLITENNYYRESMKYLFDRHKEEFFELLRNKESEQIIYYVPKNIQIRIWVLPKFPERVFNSIINKHWHKYLTIRNYESLGSRGKTDNLKFEVYPNPQGIVGKCFNSKKVEYSWDLKKEDQKIVYNMTQTQDEQTNDLRFCLCYPVKENGRVIAVISFDSMEPMCVGNNMKDKMLADLFVGYSMDLYKSSTHLFK